MASPYISNTEADRQEMLRAIGVQSSDQLFLDIPEFHRDPHVDIPKPLSELELLRELRAASRLNANVQDYACFLGGGSYNHYVPSVVKHVVGRSEFYTSYTPYQAEISQGTLQHTFEFQSLVCDLTGMDVANAGMYDGSTAMAEAALMACRSTKRRHVSVLDTVSPLYLEILRTYLNAQDIQIDVQSPGSLALDASTACLIAQYPNYYGCIDDLSTYVTAAHDAGALMVVAANPIALGLLRSPGSFGADIVVGEGQPLGSSTNFGGPYLGLFACNEKHLRQMPGRIVGKTTDTQGREGYVLTLQTREQHIRRETATSNICTSESLVALAATVYLSALGPGGLRTVAEQCYHKAHYAAQRISELPGYSLPMEGSFFSEFVVRCPRPPAEINATLAEHNVIGGLDVSDQIENGMLICVTEMNPREQIDSLVELLAA